MDGEIALVVNAGGVSRRMGRNKALLPVPPSDIPLILHIVQRLAPLVRDEIIVVANDPLVGDVMRQTGIGRVVTDQYACGGALGGVATGLEQCAGWAMVVACDMPFVSPSLFRTLWASVDEREVDEADAVIPRVGGKVQPFHGLWHRRGLPTLRRLVAAQELRVQNALAQMRVAWRDDDALGIDANNLAFWNVNSPQDWAQVLAILAEQTKLTEETKPTAQ